MSDALAVPGVEWEQIQSTLIAVVYQMTVLGERCEVYAARFLFPVRDVTRTTVFQGTGARDAAIGFVDAATERYRDYTGLND